MRKMVKFWQVFVYIGLAGFRLSVCLGCPMKKGGIYYIFFITIIEFLQ